MRRASASDIFPIVGAYRDSPYLLTQHGRLVAMLSSNARDPDGRDDAAFLASTLTLENALAALPPDAHIQQWLWHGPAVVPEVAPRAIRTAQRVGEARMQHLARRSMFQTRLLTAITLDTKALAGKTNWVDLINALLSAAVDRSARNDLKRTLHIGSSLKLLSAAVDHCAERLRDATAQFIARLSIHQDHRLLSPAESWAWCRALAQLDPRAFASTSEPPRQHWYASLASGPIEPIRVEGIDQLRCSGSGSFVRIGTITRLHERTTPAFWAAGTKPIIGVKGAFLLSINASPLTAIGSALRFKAAQNQIDQAKLSVLGLLKSATGQKVEAKPNAILDQQEKELSEAQASVSRWWHVNCYAVAFGPTAESAAETSLALDTALSNANVGVTWESAITIDAFAALQPGAKALPPRAHLLNSTQIGALALCWSHSQGDHCVADLGGEEPLTFLETRDGQLYGFNPFVGEKSTVIVVGPTRSGKTFAKNALLAHFPKYEGARLVAIDYDPGSECLAQLYGDDAALVRGGHGLNPFAAQNGPGFTAHFSRLAMAMIAANDDALLASLGEGDQIAMDSALQATLLLPQHMRSLSSFVHHLPLNLRHKFSRWVKDGEARYAELLDAPIDRVGLIDRAVTVFNLTHLRDDPKARGPIIMELLYRITTAFEDPSRRANPKTLALDEFHLALKDPLIADYVEAKARTLAKWLGSMWLLTQQPHELRDIPKWDAIRTSASTYLFTAAPEVDRATYADVFKLTTADIHTIERLVPKSEIYLVQPDVGTRKVLRLDPDAETLRYASSTARVVAEREAASLRLVSQGA